MTKEQDIRDLTERHSGLVYAIANRFALMGIEKEELIQSGFVGLIRAASSFDDSRGAAFSSYAFKFIEGEMREFARKNRAIPFPKRRYAALLELKNRIEAAQNESRLASRLNAAAEELGLNEKELSGALFELEMLTSCVSLDNEADLSKLERIQTTVEHSCFEEKSIDGSLIKELLIKIEPLERSIIELRYFEDKTQSETAQTLRISQASVSKLEKKALLVLKNMIGKGSFV